MRLSAPFALLLFTVASCSPAPPTSSAPAPRCRVATPLPGAEPFSPELSAALAAAPVPTEAPGEGPRACNRLALEPGAFARKHAVDPVDWREWSPAVLAESQLFHRPLFVWTGFAAGTATDGPAVEDFSDAELATTLNRAFVPVLVDRDERPDVDAYLMDAVSVLTGGGGWPAAVFLDADAGPFEACSWGAAASPCGPVKQVAERVGRRIALGSGSFATRADLTTEKMQKRAALDLSGPLPDAKAVSDSLRGYLAASFHDGAFGEPPLFPRAPALAFLLGRRGDAEAVAMAVSTLDALRASPMRDRDGGYFRFAAKEGWKEPAQEKMLADNAALLPVFLDAAEATGREDLGNAARELAVCLLDRFELPGGAFALALAADGSRDERVSADANAVAIAALLRAGRQLGDARFTAAALRAAEFVDARLRRGGRVLHVAHTDGSVSADGYLADSALLALAFVDLDADGAAGGSRWIDAARAIAGDLVARFEQQGSGGFFQTASDAQPLPLRLKPMLDAAVPSGNSAAALLLGRLARRGGDAEMDAAARRTFEAFSEPLTLRPLVMPAMVAALQEWSRDAKVQASAPPQLDPAPAVHP